MRYRNTLSSPHELRDAILVSFSVRPLGAVDEVGRSAFLLEAEGKRVLLDYGIKLQPKQRPLFPPEVGRVDAVLLTHTHLDHSGALPTLCHGNGCPPVYGIDVTRDFMELLLYDSIKVAKRRGYPLHFNSADVKRVLGKFRPVEYGVTFRLGPLEITPFDAGHIPGSAMYLIKADGSSLLYTGDYNLKETRLCAGADTNLPEVDVLITETTYSDREHPKRKGQELLLKEVVSDTLRRGGLALVAGFAIARLNEVAMALQARGQSQRAYLDGMARACSEIIQSYPHRLRDPDEFGFSLRHLAAVEHWKDRGGLAKGPNVVLTTSGMLEGGPAHFYIDKRKTDPVSSITLTGYQIDGTEGRRLLNEGEMFIDGQKSPIDMRVSQLDFSSHVGRTDLRNFVELISPSTVVPVHGESPEKFGSELKARMDVEVILPELEQDMEF